MDSRIIENLFFIHAQFLFSASIYKSCYCGSNWVRHGSTTISYPQCSLTFMRDLYA